MWRMLVGWNIATRCELSNIKSNDYYYRKQCEKVSNWENCVRLPCSLFLCTAYHSFSYFKTHSFETLSNFTNVLKGSIEGPISDDKKDVDDVLFVATVYERETCTFSSCSVEAIVHNSRTIWMLFKSVGVYFARRHHEIFPIWIYRSEHFSSEYDKQNVYRAYDEWNINLWYTVSESDEWMKNNNKNCNFFPFTTIGRMTETFRVWRNPIWLNENLKKTNKKKWFSMFHVCCSMAWKDKPKHFHSYVLFFVLSLSAVNSFLQAWTVLFLFVRKTFLLALHFYVQTEINDFADKKSERERDMRWTLYLFKSRNKPKIGKRKWYLFGRKQCIF